MESKRQVKSFCKQCQISEGTFYSARKQNSSTTRQSTVFIALSVSGPKELHEQQDLLKLQQQTILDLAEKLAQQQIILHEQSNVKELFEYTPIFLSLTW